MTDNIPGNESFPIGDYLATIKATLGGPATPNECGLVNEANPPGENNSLTGDACAKLGMKLNGTLIAGNLGFRAEADREP